MNDDFTIGLKYNKQDKTWIAVVKEEPIVIAGVSMSTVLDAVAERIVVAIRTNKEYDWIDK